jgi:hypothetical protein
MPPPPSFEAYPANPQDFREPFRSIGGLGVATIVLISCVTLFSVLLAVRYWSAGGLASQYLNNQGGVTQDDVVNAALQIGGLALFYELVTLAAGVLFVVWNWRARLNAEALGGPDSQRVRRRGWTLWGWICPIADLFIPYQIVVDVYRASSRGSAGGAIVGFWWAAWLVADGASIVQYFYSRATLSDATDVVNLLHASAVSLSIVTVCQVIAAALIAVIITRINSWQSPRWSAQQAVPPVQY